VPISVNWYDSLLIEVIGINIGLYDSLPVILNFLKKFFKLIPSLIDTFFII
jgi:hypothetical protein